VSENMICDFSGRMDETLTNDDINNIIERINKIKTGPIYGSNEHQGDCLWMRYTIKRLVEEHLFLLNQIKDSCFLEK
jgi:hypothetical protein